MICGINIQKVLDVMQFVWHDKGRLQEVAEGLAARAALRGRAGAHTGRPHAGQCSRRGRAAQGYAPGGGRAAGRTGGSLGVQPPCPLPELTLKRNVLGGLLGLYGKNVVLYPLWVGKWR